MASDINPLLLDERTQLRPQGLFGDQIDRAAQLIFQIELDAEITLGRSGAIESDQLLPIAAAGCRIANS